QDNFEVSLGKCIPTPFRVVVDGRHYRIVHLPRLQPGSDARDRHGPIFSFSPRFWPPLMEII
ncbi:hypothetical protein, partial [Escherichia coli]|uniref:hypothetical protein n=1 Tax=Escherichia coli TaxID=562 RepID=UPI00227E3335